MKRKFYKCFKCKITFPEEEMLSVPSGKTTKRYCLECAKERVKYEKFSECVCRIFDIKAPGPVLNKQRANYLAQGYTDELIISLIEYLNKKNPLRKQVKIPAISCFITSENIEEMKMSKLKDNFTAQKLAEGLINTEYKTIILPYAYKPKKVGYDIEDLGLGKDE